MVKKFNANCTFGSQVVPVTLYVGNPAIGSHPLNFQSKWLSQEKGGNIPLSIMNSFAKLAEIAEKNRVPFEDLCAYVIEELQSGEKIKKDAKKATAISKPEKEDKNNESK